MSVLHLPEASAEVPNYAAAGVPAADHPWTVADYQQALAVFSKEKVPLPTLSDPAGATLFSRIVSDDGLINLLDASVPLNARMSTYMALQDGANGFLKLYLTAHNEGRLRVPTELVRLMSLLLRLGSIGLSLTGEFIPTIPRDESYEVRMAGIQKMRAGMSKIFSGLEQTLSETKVYSASDLSELLQAMKRELPAYQPMFEPGFSLELAKKLEGHVPNFKAPSDREALQSMITVLQRENTQTANAGGRT